MAERLRIRLVEASKYHAPGRLFKPRTLLFPPMTLPHLAALAPDDVEVKIESELWDDLDYDAPSDIVGLSVFTTMGMRVYEVADEYRRRGRHVVLGGIHASAEPEEAAEHADTVIIGEAEETWPLFIEDFRSGRPQRFYHCEKRPALEGLPIPRYDLLDAQRYASRASPVRSAIMRGPRFTIQTARGCPYGCEYCAVAAFNGRKYRPRPIPDVVAELRALRPRIVLFADDDIFASPARARELFEALIPFGVRWIGQAGINAGKDPELLRLARRSGCTILLIGIESLSRRDLDFVGKRQNRVEEYERCIRNYHEAGIVLQCNMMFGFGSEGPDDFAAATDFLIRNRVTLTKWWPVMPLPGTPLYQRLKDEGRLYQEKWWLEPPPADGLIRLKFSGHELGEELFREHYQREYERFYSVVSILKRTLLPPRRTFPLEFFVNLRYKTAMTQALTSIEV